MDRKYLKELIIARLNAIPPDVSFSIGEYGDFTRNQLIEEVKKETKIGEATINMELNFLKKMPKLAEMVE